MRKLTYSASFQRKLESRMLLNMKEILDSNFRWNDEVRSAFFILGQTGKLESREAIVIE